MEIIQTVSNKGLIIDGPKLIKPKIYNDERGIFYESWNKKNYGQIFGNNSICQENISKSKLGVIRGLHFQIPPFSQAKLVRCSFGEIFDVAVDLRKNSPTLGQWVGVLLNNKNNFQLYIPNGFAHGFLSLIDNSEVTYLVDNFWSQKNERTIIWSDPFLNITWPIESLNNKDILLSEKDKNALSFEQYLSSSKNQL